MTLEGMLDQLLAEGAREAAAKADDLLAFLMVTYSRPAVAWRALARAIVVLEEAIADEVGLSHEVTARLLRERFTEKCAHSSFTSTVS